MKLDNESFWHLGVVCLTLIIVTMIVCITVDDATTISKRSETHESYPRN
jgi:hypothetical protein